MRTITTTLYHFNELPTEKAKENAREWWRDKPCNYYSYAAEASASIKAFAEYFGVRVSSHCFSSNLRETRIEIHGLTKDTFAGINTYITDRDYMPTGYCFDCALWATFYDEVREHGDPLLAFNRAILAVREAITEDVKHQESDEYIDETLTMNEYEFTEDGKLYKHTQTS
jgi:hypothetical protein